MSPDFSSQNGIILVDKPAGITSAGVVGRVKHRFGFSRVGHGGTLDPMATGLLVVLCGKATRLQDALFAGEKEYCGEIFLGLRTDTNDITGNVLSEVPTPTLDVEALRNIRQEFSGWLDQIPPDVSAVHVQGKRSYDRVRRGETVVLASRKVRVDFLDFEMISERKLHYRVRVSKGTYIRSLARDIGERLGCGATLGSIRRSRIGSFQVNDAQSFEGLVHGTIEPHIFPIEDLLNGMESLTIADAIHRDLFAGKGEFLCSISSGNPAQKLALIREDGRFCGLLECRSTTEESDSRWQVGFLLSPEELSNSSKAL